MSGLKLARMADARGPQRGFRECLADLVNRRLGQLGAQWDRVTPRSRRAEAARQARIEMSRRIETQTGRRYAASTIQRWAAHQHTPPGVETFFLERWAVIDRAGGIAALAASLRVPHSRVVAWRDSPDPDAKLPAPIIVTKPGEKQRVAVAVNGFAMFGTTRVDVSIPSKGTDNYQELEIDPESGILEAWYNGDLDGFKDLLGPVIAEQVLSDWNPAGFYVYSYTVTEVIDFLPDLDES